MPVFVLTQAEAHLCSAIERGAAFAMEAGVAGTVRAVALRRLVLGLPVRQADEREARVVRWTSAGLRIERVEIVGAFDLDDVATADGGPVPPLAFDRCLFREPIRMNRARIQNLSFAGCRVSHLAAVGLDVGGSVDLSDLSSSARPDADPQDLCWVELREARIAGSLIAPRAALVAPAARAGPFSTVNRAEYALDMRAATIGAEVNLSPGFRALGGINLRSAQVGRDVIGSGADLAGVEGYALLAAGAKIGGSVIFNVSPETSGPRPFRARGDVTFLDATIDGSLELRGADLTAFVATNATVGGALLLGAYQVGSSVYRTTGTAAIDATRIAGALNLEGSCVGSVNARSATIGGSALLRMYESRPLATPLEVTGAVTFGCAKIAGDLDCSGAEMQSIDAQNAEVGGSMFIRAWEASGIQHRFRASGCWLHGIKITGNLDACGASTQEFYADNAQIRGAAFLRAFSEAADILRFRADDTLSLMGCRIGGNLELSGASVGKLFGNYLDVGGAVLLRPWGGHDAAIRFRAHGPIGLSGMRVGGNFEATGAFITELQAENAEIGGSVFMGSVQQPGGKPSFSASKDVSLLGAKVGADLDLSGAQLSRALLIGNMDVGGSVWLNVCEGRSVTAGSKIDLSGSRIVNSLTVRQIAANEVQAIEVDLRHATVEVLDDDNGTAWSGTTILRLEGFQYGRLAVSRPTEAAHTGRRSRRTAERQNAASSERLRWLQLQYPVPDRPLNINDYSPDVYDRLAKAFRSAGYYADARAIIRERLRIDRRITGNLAARPFLASYALFFDSGLSPWRAIGTFLGCIVIGWVAPSWRTRTSRRSIGLRCWYSRQASSTRPSFRAPARPSP